MGHLIYGVAPAIAIDDWALEHLRFVIVTKLRRDESFSFSWENEPDVDGDVTRASPGVYGTVWISKSSSLYFSFDKPRAHDLNRHWLDALARAANSSSGLRLVPEPTSAA
ncbi:hypothetical protein [Microbacterium yannicii]|jgi:hypothetical protein|uniref:DUF7882 family protein n=1 Tax=Microbacterium yannicii TaxID=671622 RepID=UPI00031E7BE2|nr:hypothetical protein [Microbacterium yannicii]